MRIGWAITGAGHFLKETVDLLIKLAEKHEVTVFISNAGEEVLKMYGLYEQVAGVTGGYYKELALDSDQSFSYPISGRLSLGKYDLLIVSPATANSVAKIVNGISDSLVTNCVAQAGKGGVQTLIVPVDLELRDVHTILPSKLELSLCTDCKECSAANTCPNEAILPKTEIDLLKCVGCGKCKDACPYDVISEGKTVTIHMREIDIENSHKLVLMKGIYVLREPAEIEKHI
ncbi:MAG: dihydromethanopterin reductase (acceptor) [Methanobrevibacter sp.]|nr:dihydromethanopterin reductase (acceptor) [Methanobrevibacter sp.]